jgi:hypothetical protein
MRHPLNRPGIAMAAEFAKQTREPSSPSGFVGPSAEVQHFGRGTGHVGPAEITQASGAGKACRKADELSGCSAKKVHSKG